MYVGGARFYCLYRSLLNTLWIAVIGFLVFKRGATTSIVLCPSIASFSSVSLSIGDTPSLPRRPPGLRRRRTNSSCEQRSASARILFDNSRRIRSCALQTLPSPPPLCPPVSAVILRGKRERRRLIDAVTRLMVKINNLTPRFVSSPALRASGSVLCPRSVQER